MVGNDLLVCNLVRRVGAADSHRDPDRVTQLADPEGSLAVMGRHDGNGLHSAVRVWAVRVWAVRVWAVRVWAVRVWQ